MNIVFMGTPDFAVPSLEILHARGYNIAAVVTAPDKPRGRGQQVSVTPVKAAALNHSLPLLQPDNLKDEHFISELRKLRPDLFIIVAFRILPKEVYSIPAKGAFNLHASLLPKYRGAAPINWAIINGEKETGVTSFFLQDKVDTGNIILSARTVIRDDMNAGELHDVLSEIGAEIVLQTVRLIELGKVQPRQQDNTLATPAPKIFKETCRINWNQSLKKIYDFIRGLSPSPAAWTVNNGKVIKIFRSSQKSEAKSRNSEAGEITVDKGKLFVSAVDGELEILELQQEGRRRMTAEEFLRGYKFKGKDSFH
ncbi:MAG: methionyl-tRNA formyltransferase [Ignavibacteriales bacterium]|nr:methionyl-tRNA formyltransferase [Ignavibacteriales bacterium]